MTKVIGRQEKDTTNVIFAARLREAMDSSAVTQVQLAAAAGCTQSAISLYLKGRVPNGEMLVALARALGTSAEALLGIAPVTATSGGEWKQRALSAEQRLDALKAGMQALLKNF